MNTIKVYDTGVILIKKIESKKDDFQLNGPLGYNSKEDIVIPVTNETHKRLKGTPFDKAYHILADYITPVKTQYVGNCWTFATIALLETYCLQKGWTSKSDAQDSTFSETHMTYSSFDIRGTSPATVVNPEGRTPEAPKSPDQVYRYGGSRISALLYCSKRENTVLEAIDPNFLKKSVRELPKRENSLTKLKYRRFLVTQAYFIEDPVVEGRDPSFIDRIKYALKKYGPVYIAFFFDSVFAKKVKYKTFGETNSYYMNNMKNPDEGHAVTIVGWDDDFNDFVSQPKTPGAFRVKNSWGTGGNKGDGYIWISYENIGCHGAFCITEMKEDKDEYPVAVTTHNNFGMLASYPNSVGESKITFEDAFITNTDGEEIFAIGLCCFTPCFATVRLFIGGSTISLLTRFYLRLPGYHLVDVQKTSLGISSTQYKIEVTYDSIPFSSVFVPMEYKYLSGYDNLNLKTVSGSIKLGSATTRQTITDINSSLGTKYGNIALYVYTKGTGADANNNFLAFKDLNMPTPTATGRIDNLSQSIKPSGATAAVAIDWRIEPYQFASYNSGYRALVSMYKTGSAVGMVNTSASTVKIFVTAIIGSGKFAMKKLFISDIPAQNKTYTFTMSGVTNANEVDISGQFEIAGATVAITSNNSSATVKTDASGNWSISKFALYDVFDGGWKDSYAKSKVNVTIVDDNKLVLCEGTQNVSLTKPYKESGNTVYVLVASAVGLIAGLFCCIYQGLTTCRVPPGKYYPRDDGYVRLETPDQELSLVGENSATEATIIVSNGPLLSSASSLENLVIESSSDNRKGESSKSQFAGVVQRITKGGYVKNCKVKLNVSGVDEMGGIFYEGEDVTISGCSVTANISDVGSCGLIAHNLTGKSVIDSCTVSGSIEGDTVAGLAVNVEGSIKNCAVNLQASAKTQAAGICLNASGAIEGVLVQGSYSATGNGAMSSGIASVFNGGSIKDCRVSAAIGCTSDAVDNCAAGIACDVLGNTVIHNSIVAGSLSSGAGGSSFGIAPGIAGKPDSISRCISFYSVIRGKNPYRISRETSSECISYDLTQCDAGAAFVSTGEQIKNADALLNQDTYTDLNYDFTNRWIFIPKKLFPALQAFTTLSYDYPFPNPYATQSGKYSFSVGTPLALYGAASPMASKMTWKNLSPLQGVRVEKEPAFEFMKAADEFYLQMHLSFDTPGQYTVDIAAVIENFGFNKTIVIEIKK